MIKINIPNYDILSLKYLVLDYNGTLAVDGCIEPNVSKLLNHLSDNLIIHVITADTFGVAKSGLAGINCQLTVLDCDSQEEAKLNFVQGIGVHSTVSVGNGRNDRLMLKHSILGIAVILSEGLAVETMFTADVVCKDIVSALELLLNPMRLLATLRS